MKKKSYFIIHLISILLLSNSLKAETAVYGGKEGWQSIITMGISETDGWRGYKAITLSPLGRNPFADSQKDTQWIDLLLLASQSGIDNPPSRYRVEGNFDISDNISARGEYSIHPTPDGIKLYPSPSSMWTAGTEWGDFTLDFLLNPISLRDGEVFFLWEGRDESGLQQSVTAKVDKRRLVWEFRNFFKRGLKRSLDLSLVSTPLVPGQWRHHRIRFTQKSSTFDNLGSSPGLLEYLVDGIPADIIHATPDGRESDEVFQPRIGKLSDSPLYLGPKCNVYFDEFSLSSIAISSTPVGMYVRGNTTALGTGRTEAVDTGYPGSALRQVKTRFDTPGLSKVSFYIASAQSRNELIQLKLPTPDAPEWTEIMMKPQQEDPMGFGRWYTGKADQPVKGRYLILGYILYPDPSDDTAPIISTMELEYDPRLPPQPPRDVIYERDDQGNITLSWSPLYDKEITGWWLFWGPRSGDYTASSIDDEQRGRIWVSKPEMSGQRPSFVWPSSVKNPIVYLSIRAAWEDGGPDNATPPRPSSYNALSDYSKEIHFRP